MCKLPRAAANRLLWVWLENELQSGVGPPTSPLYLSIRQLLTSAPAAGIITIQSHNTLLLCCCRVIAQRADAQKTSRRMFGVDEICVENLGHNSNEITLIVFNLLWRAGRPSNSQTLQHLNNLVTVGSNSAPSYLVWLHTVCEWCAPQCNDSHNVCF